MQQEFSVTASRILSLVVLGLFWASLFMASATAAEQACGALEVKNAWLRVVPGAPVSAAYFDLENSGDAAVTLVAVSSPQFERASMHDSVVGDDGMATMQPVAAVVIPSGDRVAFAPGGYHVMLFEPTQALAPGDSVALQLQCNGQQALREVTAVVRDVMGSGQQDMNGDHDHMHMQHGE